jgi:hypothetical protein
MRAARILLMPNPFSKSFEFRPTPPATLDPSHLAGVKGSATLDKQMSTGNYDLTLGAPTLESARLLYHGIRTGTLLPWEPWDEPQIKKPKVRIRKT